MARKSPIRVLLLSADHSVVERWAQALSDESFCVAHGDNGAARPIEVILTDPGSLEGMGGPLRERLERHAAAVVSVGDGAAAGLLSRGNVALPSDATDRELVLACRLVGEAVRLRRHLRRAVAKRRRFLQLAETDPLTGLPNRRAWERELAGRLRPATAGRRACLAIIDLDHFKRFNDAQGHAAGDRLLAAVGRALKAAVREAGFVARLGGDEFGILLADVDETSAAAIVERMHRHIAEPSEAAPEPVRASAGYVVSISAQADGSALFEAADRALTAAKRAGRDRTMAATGVVQ